MSFKVRVAVSLACAAIAVAIMLGYAASVRGEAAAQRAGALERYGGETAAVCVAARDIAQGETLGDRNVEVVEWLVDLLPEGSVSDLASLTGKTAASAIARNTPIAAIDVSLQGERFEVPAGLVAVSVPCSNESAVGGALVAGSMVDVYVVSGEGARLLCQGVQVLATNAEGTAANLSWATLAVDPSGVEAVIAASSVQRLYFVLPSAEEIDRRAHGGAETSSEFVGTAVDGGDVPPVEGDGSPETVETPSDGDGIWQPDEGTA